MSDNSLVLNDLHAILGSLTLEQLAAIRAAISPPADAPAHAPPEPAPKKKRERDREAIKYFTADELEAFFAAVYAAGNVRDVAIFELAYHRGLRVSEVGLLQMGHLRINVKRLHVPRLKGGNSHDHYPLTEREIKACRAWIRKRGTKAGPLFPSRLRKAISRQQLDRLTRRYAIAAGIGDKKKRHFHCLRHTCAVMLLEHDATMEEVQDHLGHVEIGSTQVYARISEPKRRRLAERLEKEW